AIGRRFFNQRLFLNDPDVFILREAKNRLTQSQKYTLFLVNLLFGDLVFTSDYIEDYDATTLHLYNSAFPFLPRKIQAVRPQDWGWEIEFEIADKQYLAYINHTKKKKMVFLPEGRYFRSGGPFIVGKEAIQLEAWGSVCLYRIPEGDVGLAGSTLHIFPGAAIAKLTYDGQNVQLNLAPELQNEGRIWLMAPKNVDQLYVNGKAYQVDDYKGLRMAEIPLKPGT
ncbi:MAG: hypothetical protein AAF570_02410, partial [Bacteroidota bacterium]